MNLRTHGFVPFSYANGPGCRATLWLQGCPLDCPGCFNADTHAFDQGQSVEVGQLLDHLKALAPRIEGLTISGGEPLMQDPALSELVHRVRSETSLSIILFTGFTWEETLNRLRRTNGRPQQQHLARLHPTKPIASRGAHGEGTPIPSLLPSVDVLIAGRYDQRQRLARGLRGSANKTLHFFTQRYSAEDIQSVPTGEAIIAPDGSVTLSGMESLKLKGENTLG